MRRFFGVLTAVLLASSLTASLGWACSPAWNESMEIDAIDPAGARTLPDVTRVGGEAYRTDDEGCGECGDTREATFNIKAAVDSQASGIQFDFPDGKPEGIGFTALMPGTEPDAFWASKRGAGYFVRIPWDHSGPVQVRVRLVDNRGAAGEWSDPIVVRQQSASCSSGLGWPFFLLALAWRPLRRRRNSV